MEREPPSSVATSAPAALFAWVRDSAPAPGRLGLRGARRRGAPGLRVGGPTGAGRRRFEPGAASAGGSWAGGGRGEGGGKGLRGVTEGACWPVGSGRRGCGSVARTCPRGRASGSARAPGQTAWMAPKREDRPSRTLWVTGSPHPAWPGGRGRSPAPPQPGGSLLPSAACGVWRRTKAETLHHRCCSAVAGACRCRGRGGLRGTGLTGARRGRVAFMSWLGERRAWQVLRQMPGSQQTRCLSSS